MKTLSWLFVIVFISSCATHNSHKSVNKTESDISSSNHEETNIHFLNEHLLNEYRASKHRDFDLIHTKLDVSFDWQKQYLYGKAWLTLKPYFYPQKSLVLDAKGFDIKKVALVLDDSFQPLEYTYDKKRLHITLDSEYERTDSFNIFVEYVAKPNELELGGSLAITMDKGLYFIDPMDKDPNKPQQIWTQGETESSSCWFPTIDAPNERCTQEMYITVHNKYLTLSNGVFMYSNYPNDSTRTDYWKMDQPHAPYLFMMSVGEFAVVKDQWEDIDVNYYVEPHYKPYAKDIFGNTPEMLTFFSKKLGYKYPWSKYSQIVVRDYVSGAMENTTASIFMEYLHITKRERIDSHWDNIIAHELFHQWFGDLVTCESWPNLPLNESFATYSEYLWNEYKYGVEEADYKLLSEMDDYKMESLEKKVDMIRFYYEDKEHMFDRHSYAKGACILHMLRTYLGEDAFFAALQLYLNTNEYTSVEIHDLRLAFEEISGEDLNWFFNQWFLASGHPEIKVNQSYLNDELRIVVEQTQDLKTTPLYRLPLFVDVWVKGEKKRFPMEINKARQEFIYAVDEKPSLVLFDGDQTLLADITHEKSFEEMLFQYYNSDKVIARIASLDYVLSDSIESLQHEMLRIDAMNDSFWALRQDAVRSFYGYKGEENMKKIIEKILKIIHTDNNSYVRSDAIKVLSSIDSIAYRSEFENYIEDSSYVVIGASIQAYSKSLPQQERLAFFENLEPESNINITTLIANFYAQEKIEHKQDWFVQQIEKCDGWDLPRFITHYGNYLFSQQESVFQQSKDTLEDLARNHSAYYVRFAAYKALNLFAEQQEVKTMLNDIKSKEKNSRLIKIYNSM